MLLYIHVPFCRRKCPYCAFYSVPSADPAERIAVWRKALREEMRQAAGLTGCRDVESIFFGGGTPSLLPPETAGSIIDDCARLFSLAGGIEISMEANPDSVSQAAAQGFRLAGMNRVSLGVQALDDELLRSLGRLHDKKQAAAAFTSLRKAGFDNIGMDLMWGLPGETCAAWSGQLREAVDMHPEHISCYGLTIEEGTPFSEHIPQLPTEGDLARMYLDCGDILEKNGYIHYEISNYALPGKMCEHNRGYWLGRDYLGFGPSAVSCIGGRRMTRPPDIDAWACAAMRGESAGIEEILSPAEKVEEFLMLRLRMAEGLSFSEYASLTGRDLRKDEASFLRQMEKEELADCSGGRLRLTRRGMLLSNSIISRLFTGVAETA